MRKAWRIVKAKHKRAAFSGSGSQFASGRWHNLMIPVVYCSDSLALVALETFVHVLDSAKHIQYVSFEIDIPDNLVLEVESITKLPRNWRAQPAGSSTKKTGSEWVQSNASPVLSVPSAIIPSSRNLIINPQHIQFSQIKIGRDKPFIFDARLWK